MICKTHNRKEIKKFLKSCIAYAKNEACTYISNEQSCDCNHCRIGAGSLSINGEDHQYSKEKLTIKNLQTCELIYTTGSGSGEYGYEPNSKILVFCGRRKSLYTGSDCFCASGDGDWELVESQRADRGVWGRSYYITSEQQENKNSYSFFVTRVPSTTDEELLYELADFVYYDTDLKFKREYRTIETLVQNAIIERIDDSTEKVTFKF